MQKFEVHRFSANPATNSRPQVYSASKNLEKFIKIFTCTDYLTSQVTSIVSAVALVFRTCFNLYDGAEKTVHMTSLAQLLQYLCYSQTLNRVQSRFVEFISSYFVIGLLNKSHHRL